jgi:serine/threonine protein kinase/tetratricopeptide (TPR) repeat protein
MQTLSPERWREVSPYLDQVFSLPEDQRATWLESLRTERPDLANLLQDLLEEHRALAQGQFLERSPVSDATESSLIGRKIENAAVDRTNQVIGQYRMVQELGRGGMGVVYVGEDLKLGRKVAIKFLPGELAHDPAAFERFGREARAASALDHRNICSIYQFGEFEGQPFIVMQLLEGQTLREWIEKESHDSPGQHQQHLVDIAIQIADGLDAAHQKGIIHRDIKPANIFLTKRREIKILDFGVAKFLDASEPTLEIAPSAQPAILYGSLTLTRTGLIGTPSYLSPEQIRGEKLDARTDLFSLGLVLYEMATGRRTFAGSTLARLRESGRTAPSIPVRQLNPALSPKLEAIIAKALEPERDRRFQSAVELRSALEDLRTQLGPAARRRRKRQLWLAAAAAMILLVGVSYWVSVRRVLRNAALHPALATAVKPRRSVAVLGFKNLTGKPDQEWLSTALVEMLTTELASGEQLRAVPAENVASVKLQLSLPSGDVYSQDILRRIRSALASEIVVVGSYMVVKGKQHDSMRLDLRVQDTATGEASSVLTETGSNGDLLEVIARAGARLREALGVARMTPTEQLSVQASLPSSPEAARLYAEGLAKLRVFDNVAAHDLLQRAVDAEPSNALAHSALAASWTALGYDSRGTSEAKKAFDLSANVSREDRLVVESRYREATHDWDKAIAIHKSLSALFPDNIEYGLHLAEDQGNAHKDRDAMATIVALRAYPTPEKDDPRIDLAEAMAAKGMSDFPRALTAAEAARQKAKAQGTNLILAQAREMQGIVLDRKGDAQGALAALGEARGLYEKSGDKKLVAQALNDTAVVQWRLGNLAEALRLYEQTGAICESTGNVNGAATALQNIGIVLYDQGKLPEAKASYERALAGHRKAGEVEGVVKTLNSLANIYADQGNQAEAQKMYEESLSLSREIDNKIDEAIALSNLGLLAADKGDLSTARQRLEEALAIKRQIGNRPSIASTISSLGDVLLTQGDLAAARKIHEEALAIRTEIGQKAVAAEDQLALANVAFEEGNLAAARDSGHSAEQEFHSDGRADWEALVHLLLARVLLAQQNPTGAQAEVEAAQRLSAKTENQIARLELEITSVRVQAALGKSAEALKNLEIVRQKAARGGLLGVGLEARLAWGEIALRTKNSASARLALAALRKDAQTKGFGLIARDAAAAR